jgi:hypothetical protein
MDPPVDREQSAAVQYLCDRMWPLAIDYDSIRERPIVTRATKPATQTRRFETRGFPAENRDFTRIPRAL